MSPHLRAFVFITFVYGLWSSACSATAAGAIVVPTAPSGGGGETGGEGGVEAALVTYSDAAQGFAIGYPGRWTQDTSFLPGVRFVGGNSSMTLEFSLLPPGADAMSFAQDDVPAVAAAFPLFHELSLAPSTEVDSAAILGFEAVAISTVTGKEVLSHNERYYMPLADGRIAILTVGSPANQYDREGVRDIALTFRSTP